MSHEVFLTERWQNKHRVLITLDGVGFDLMPSKPRLDENRRRRFPPISHRERVVPLQAVKPGLENTSNIINHSSFL